MTVAGIYVRVSTEDQAQKYSLDSQREACARRARELGAMEIIEFSDPGVSGEIVERPGLSKLRDAVEAKAISLVVALDPDRLARKLGLQIVVTEEIEKAGCRLDFVDFEWKNTDEGQLYYHMRGAFAQYEKAKIKRRTSYGRQQKAKRGQLPLRFKPYGYDFDPVHDTLAVNEAEAAAVRDMFRWLLDEGLGPNAIARRLQSLGVPTPGKAVQWYRTTVTRILENYVYTGRFVVNRYDCTGMGLNKHLSPHKRVRPKLRPEDQWITISVPVIISEDVWKRAHNILQNARRMWAGKPRQQYLLSGLLTCGECSSPMHGSKSYRRYYTCRSSDGSIRYGCAHWVPSDRLEEQVWQVVWQAVHDPQELVDEVANADDCDSKAPLQAELDAVEAGLRKKEKARKGFALVMARGDMEPEEAAEALRAISDEVAALEAQRHRIQAMLSARAKHELDMESLAMLATKLDEAMSFGERQHLLRQAVERIMVYRGRISVYLRVAPALAEDGRGGLVASIAI